MALVSQSPQADIGIPMIFPHKIGIASQKTFREPIGYSYRYTL